MEVNQIEVEAGLEAAEDEEAIVEEVAGRRKDQEEDVATVTQAPIALFRTSWIWISRCRLMLMVMVCEHDALVQNASFHSTAPSPLGPVPAEPSRGRGTPAFRGRGRGGHLIPMQLSTNTIFPGRGRGFDIPRRQVQGIGARRVPVPVGKQTLSNLLGQERPLLKPIVFVPSTETRFLFQDEEELLQPIGEDIGGCK